jgi:hypothetical protein
MRQEYQVQDHGGRVFRDAWVSGVKRHFPGEPKPRAIAPWEEMEAWEQACAVAACDQVVAFIRAGGEVANLTREQKGRFVAAVWTVQVYRNVAEPKASHVPDWESMPMWWQQTDCDIFEAIERQLQSGRSVTP